jgi:hypothetical protein
LTTKIKKASSALFKVDVSFFDFNEIGVEYEKDVKMEETPNMLEEMSVSEVLRYLEEKDRRHYEERARLLGIIENLTKK